MPSVEDFEAAEKSIKAYVSADNLNNDWNRAVIKEHIRIYNFETIVGDRTVSHEVVALLVQRGMLEDRYQASQPVQKYHEWLLSKHPPPDTVNGVDARLAEVLGDVEFIAIARDLAKSYVVMAEHGSVPLELGMQDKAYWGHVTSIALCDYEGECDGDARRARLGIDSSVTGEQWDAFRLFESTGGIDPQTGRPYECIFIQCADAASWKKISVPRSLYVSIQPSLCSGQGSALTCQLTNSWYGTGDKSIGAYDHDFHARDTRVLVKAYSDTVDPKALNEISGVVRVGTVETSHGPVAGLGLAQIWKWVDQGRCGGRESECGTYEFTITSPDAYKWVFR